MINAKLHTTPLSPGEARYQALFRNSSDGILITTKDGTEVLDANPSACHLFGMTERELINAKRGKLVDVNDPSFQLYLDQRRQKGKARGELVLIRKNGERFPAEVTSSLFLDAEGNEKASVFIRDISERRKTTNALERSEKLYRNLFENMLHGFAYFRAILRKGKAVDVVFVAVNHEFERILGISNATGKKMSSVLPGLLQSDPQYAEMIRRVMLKYDRIKTEMRLQILDLWLSVSFYKTDENHFVTLIDDITQRKRSEEQVQLSEIRLKKAQQIGRLGYWQQNFGDDKIWASDETMKIFGLPPVSGEVHNTVLFPLVKDVDKALEEARYSYLNQLTYKTELTIFPADGSAERFVSVIAEAFQTANDPRLRIIGTIQDITDEKKSKQKIIENERKLDVIYNTVSDTIFMLNIEENNRYRFLSINNTFTKSTGLKKEEVVGKYVEEIVPATSLQRVLDKYKQSIESRSTVSWVEESQYPTGNRFGYVTVSPVIDEQGRCTMLVGSVHDITERMDAEKKLITTNEELHRLSQHLQNIREEERLSIARDIHDELGQQLTGVKMELAMLFKKIQITDASLVQKAEGILSLMDNSLKSIRRISSALRPGLLDDLGLIATLEWHSEEVERRSGIRVQFNTNIKNPELPLSTATALFRIYQEALTNVMRHAQAKKITSNLLLENGALILQVKDDGTGVHPDKAMNKKTLGLVGIKERTFILGGQYEFKSKPGKGTELKITVPYR